MIFLPKRSNESVTHHLSQSIKPRYKKQFVNVFDMIS